MSINRADREEFENDIYKAEPSFNVTSDGHIEAYNEAIGIVKIKPSGYKTKQVGGNHYAKHNIQPWDIIDEYNLDYYLGNVIKYVLRDKSNQIEDLNKAIHYLEKKIELLEHQ